MNRWACLLSSLVGITALTCAVAQALVQNASSSNATQESVMLRELYEPIYPRLAKQARVQGDVVVKLAVKRDGTVEIVEAVSGPPMLMSASLESAKKSKFDCSSCTEALTLSRVVYTFQAVPLQYDANCEVIPDARYPQVTQTQNHVTVIDQSVGICDPMSIVKVRGAKCLYLWRCGHR